MSADIALWFDTCQRMLPSIEKRITNENGWGKEWTTILTHGLPSGVMFHVQRKHCEPATIEVSFNFLVESLAVPSHKREEASAKFRNYFTIAIRHAMVMARRNVFLSPLQTVELRASKRNAALTTLRETRGILPRENFTVQLIAVVTELVSGEGRSVTVFQSSTNSELADMVREGKRQLTETILADERLAESVRLTKELAEAPTPTSVTIHADNGAIRQHISFDAMGGNIQPSDEP